MTAFSRFLVTFLNPFNSRVSLINISKNDLYDLIALQIAALETSIFFYENPTSVNNGTYKTPRRYIRIIYKSVAWILLSICLQNRYVGEVFLTGKIAFKLDALIH